MDTIYLTASRWNQAVHTFQASGDIAQSKWAAWRREEHLEQKCETQLDEQVALVSQFIDPVFAENDHR